MGNGHARLGARSIGGFSLSPSSNPHAPCPMPACPIPNSHIVQNVSRLT
ncbi:MAG: hypothetical protein KME31_13630 [Tolypothrix carrinoi HA7290-LM1]|nr:hypothetical protein [Tolypothrix carrinoi HA7290-LM1]